MKGKGGKNQEKGQEQMSSSGVKRHFEGVEDPRTGNAKEHLLIDIIVIAIMAVICGADSWVEIEEFGKAKQEWGKASWNCPTVSPPMIRLGGSSAY